MVTKSEKVTQVLECAKDLLTKKKWTRGTLARTSRGHWIDPTSEKAVSFCVLGALQACEPNDSRRELAEDLIGRVLAEKYSRFVPISQWNDSLVKSKKEVIKTLDKAIELSRE